MIIVKIGNYKTVVNANACSNIHQAVVYKLPFTSSMNSFNCV